MEHNKIPIFSVIIPHYNIPKLLQRCLDSIPDMPEIQVIVVDDNSSPDKVDFKQFPGIDRQYTQCIFDKKGGGAGHARNLGMEHAKGEWLVFADSDDFFVKDAFDILEKHKDDHADIILFKADSVCSDDYTPSDRHLKINKAVDDALSGVITSKEAVITMPGPVCKMFRRKHIESKHVLFDETYACNDVMFVLKSTCWADDDAVTVANKVVYTITTRQGSLDANKKTSPRNYLCYLDVMIRSNKFFEDYPYDKRPIIVQVFRGLKISPATFWKSLMLAVKSHALFSGTSVIFKKLFKR